jgi:hypothetical protein
VARFAGMNILLQTKEEVETHFGKKATMAPNLLGMVGQGEEAFGFLTGDMSEGFDITVGFFNGKARYIAFKKRTGTPWGEGDFARGAQPNREVFKLVGQTGFGVPRLRGKTKKRSRKRGYGLAGAKASLRLRLHPRCSRRNRDHA